MLAKLQKQNDEYIAAGDEVVFGKAGKATYTIGRFFSSLQNRVIPGLSFFVFSVINVKKRQSYPIQAIQAVQMVKRCPEPVEGKTKKKIGQKREVSCGSSEGKQE